jgi:twitching motility protein PilT
MPAIDTAIRALYENNADAVGIATGHPILVITGGQRRPLGPEPMSLARVEQMLAEVLPPAQLVAFQSSGAVEHVVETAAGAAKITARRAPNGMQIMLAPAAPSARGAPMPRGPLSMEGGPASPTTNPRGVPAPSADGPAIQIVPPMREPPPAAEPGAGVVHDKNAIDALFREMVKKGSSDLYVCTSKKPLIRKDGDLVPIGMKEMSEAEVKSLLYAITPSESLAAFEKTNDVDFAYEIPGLARFRANLFRDRFGVGGIFRQIPVEIITAEKLGLSPAILDLCMLNKGLVLVTGPTGSGKSTTLAAMIDYINRNRSAHIITIEDPIEFVHQDKRCVLNQREVGNHTEGFKRALRAALREDPDIVLVGEMRDLETVAIAIETAETGHLVFGTLHTNTAASTVDRIIDQFPADQQQQIRTMLAEALKGVISQTLLKKRGGGRVAALEVLLVQHSVSNLIREAKTHQLPSIMQTGKGAGMAVLNDAIMELVDKKLVEPAEALAKAIDRADLRARLERQGIILPQGASGANAASPRPAPQR